MDRMAAFRESNFSTTSESNLNSFSHQNSEDSIHNFIRFHINRVSSPFLNHEITCYQEEFQNSLSDETHQKLDSLKIPIHKSLTDVSQDIKALEPHLDAYQRLVRENNMMGGYVDATDNIPPQILRAIRYFPHKWTSLKRALLRPPSMDEFGSAIRLKLARELYIQNMISTPEIRLLEQAIDELKSGRPKCNKRPRDEYSIYEQLKMALTSLPLDIVSLDKSNSDNAKITNSVHHLKEVIHDYCQYSPAPGDDYPPPELVAEWSLQAFSSIIISSGISDITQTEAEVHLYQIFFDDEESKILKISSAIRNRIQEILHPDSVDDLSDLNILCLSRFLSLMNADEVASIIRRCLILCSSDRCVSVGFTTIPKLLASYISIVHHNLGKLSFQETFQSLVETQVESELDVINLKRFNAFCKNIFQSCDFILEFGGQ
jgi:hypothetical protein